MGSHVYTRGEPRFYSLECPVSLYDLEGASNGRRACGADDDRSLSNAPAAPRLTLADLLTHSRAGTKRAGTDGGSQDYVRANTKPHRSLVKSSRSACGGTTSFRPVSLPNEGEKWQLRRQPHRSRPAAVLDQALPTSWRDSFSVRYGPSRKVAAI